MAAPNTSLVTDVRLYAADNRVRRNILAVRTSVGADDAYTDSQSVTIRAGKTLALADLPQCIGFTLYAQKPLFVSGTVDGNAVATTFTAQTFLSMSTGFNGVIISNNNTSDVLVNIVRISLSEVAYVIPRHLVTFSQLSRIAPIGSVVTILANVVVQDVTLYPLVNDQVIAPSNSAGERFRICNSDGTPNATGAYIMYLNDIVTQQNFSGTLQLWVGERA